MTDHDFVIPLDRIPEHFAECIENPPAVPVVARPAATIALMRDGDSGLDILLLKRNRSAGFVPGAYVFPGGRVDTADADEEIVSRVDGLDGPAADRRLSLPTGDPPALAYYLAAVREAFEETGILIGHDSAGVAPATAAQDPEVDALRDELMEDRMGFADVLDRMRCRIDGPALEYIAHWITPEVEPRRFDTRFFAAKVPAEAKVIVDTREMSDAVWLTPAGALERYVQGALPMVFPTIKTLEQLEQYRSVNEALMDLGGQEIPTFMPRLVMTPTGLGMEVEE
jgi:8-oxo-dGTP pyrophosphatase MutT (NUDIX family)